MSEKQGMKEEQLFAACDKVLTQIEDLAKFVGEKQPILIQAVKVTKAAMFGWKSSSQEVSRLRERLRAPGTVEAAKPSPQPITPDELWERYQIRVDRTARGTCIAMRRGMTMGVVHGESWIKKVGEHDNELDCRVAAGEWGEANKAVETGTSAGGSTR